ncbi:MAG: type IV pilus biogenesis protein PilM, partial [Fibrobacterota bacterium]
MSASTNGLDIQKNYISIAQYAPLDSAVLQVAIQPLSVDEFEGNFWDTVAEELKNMKKIFRFGTPDVVCSLISEQAVIKTFQVESDEADQQEVLNWELEHHLAGSANEYAYDFQEIASGLQEVNRRYLAAAVRQEAVAKLRKTIRSVKLNPLVIDLDLFALVNVFEANYSERLSETAVLVHAEDTCTRLVLTNNGSFIDYAVFDYSADEQNEQLFCEQLRQESDRLVSVNSDFLTEGQVATFFAGSLFADQQFSPSVLNSIARSELLNPFRKISCTIGVDDEQLKTYSSQLAVAVGLALRGDEAE